MRGGDREDRWALTGASGWVGIGDSTVRCPVTLSGFGAVPDPSDHHQGGPAGALELAEVVAEGVQSPFTVGLVGAS